MDKLINLIEEGDADKILSEEELFPKFNRLVKYGLVVVEEEKVYLTQKGFQAKKEGVDVFIKKEEIAQIQNQYLSQEQFKKEVRVSNKIRNSKLIQWGFLMIVLALTFGNKLFRSRKGDNSNG